MGYALFLAQMGERHPTRVKTLGAFGGATVIEVKESHDGNAYRAVYTVRYADAIYVLHAFQKKVQEGPRDAEGGNGFDRETSERLDQGKGRTTMTKRPAARDQTRNVWLQLGFPDAEEHYLKAELVLRLDKAIKSLGLTQRVAARRIGATQPELSKILGGKFTEVSLERLMRFLTALGYHIEIKIGAGQANKAGDVTVRDGRRTAA
jgi:predicted XRE-type DNA-binding protein